MIDLETIPHLPGCYIFKDAKGTVLYVGKAKDLKKRVGTYFQKRDLDPKTERLIQVTQYLDFIATNTEVEAFLLENSLIKKKLPKYNIKLKDSSRYACIQLTEDKFPRIRISRKRSGKGTFFGPFVSAKERDLVFQVVRKTFGLRTCRRFPKRACLRYYMNVCSAPCIGEITEAQYEERALQAQSVLKGNTRALIDSMKEDMTRYAMEQRYEKAMELRDVIGALEHLQERQNMERRKKFNEDVLSYMVEGENVYLMLFKVYKGTLEGKEDFVFAYGEDFLEEFLVQYYSENEPPDELIMPETPDEPLMEFLSHVKGKRVKVTVPKQGEKKVLLDLAQKNVEISFFGDKRKLDALQDALLLPKAPNVIECFDISHLSGTSTVGSMVQFRGGRPDKRNYRRFKIKSVDGIDDFAALAEVVQRRYARLKEEAQEYPNLIIIDGGKGQLWSAHKELLKLGLKIPIISIAKRKEEIYMLGRLRPLPIEKDDNASLFVQEIRNEAHRFAIAYNRLLRTKATIS